MSSTFECCCGLRDLLMNMVPVERHRRPNWKKIGLKEQKIQCSGLCLGNTRAQPCHGTMRLAQTAAPRCLIGAGSAPWGGWWFGPGPVLVPDGNAGPNPALPWFVPGHKSRGDLSEGRDQGDRNLKQPALLHKGWKEEKRQQLKSVFWKEINQDRFLVLFFAIYSWFP